MNAKEVIIDVLSTGPCRSILASLEANHLGVKVLNKVCYPRCVFGSFQQAWDVAARVAYAGHDHPDYIQYHAQLMGHLRSSDYAVLYWLSRIHADPIKILDFGGCVGNLFYSYIRYLRTNNQEIQWTVFDLPATIEAGRQIASKEDEHGLYFTSSLDNVKEEQIILVSGSFHYWEKSIADFVNQFSTRPRDVIINRVPVHQSRPSFITLQYKSKFAHPCFVRNVNEVVSDFAKLGYSLIDRWAAPELRLRMPLFPGHNIPFYSGFYFSSRHAISSASGTEFHRAA
jgi:putative methyltransferase (TIGR04325 family)